MAINLPFGSFLILNLSVVNFFRLFPKSKNVIFGIFFFASKAQRLKEKNYYVYRFSG